MLDIDFKEHNIEVDEMWKYFYNGKAYRVPMILGFSSRYFMFNSETNPNNISYKKYSEDPELMLKMQLEFEYYKAMNILTDRHMGIPENGWETQIDFQNYFDAGWLGAEIVYVDNNVPTVKAFLDDNNKNQLFYKGIPDPFSGLLKRCKDYYELITPKLKTMSFKGVPVRSFFPHHTLYTDGPFTVACDIRGTTELCIDIFEDPGYVKELLSFLTDSFILKIKSWRKYLGLPETSDSFFFADDSILLLSKDMYEEFVLPFHQKLVKELTNIEFPKVSVHLCGDATRHFKMMTEHLNVVSFDTGFPVKHGELISELGENITIYGGPHVEILRTGTSEEIAADTIRILDEVKDKTKRFVLRDANNVAPGTPVKNLNVMYNTCREFGRF